MKKEAGRRFLEVFGVGRLPSPGTMASAFSLLILAGVKEVAGGGWMGILVLALTTGVLYFVSVGVIKRILSKDYDQRWIVIDEVAGMMISGISLWMGGRFEFIFLVTTFLWFRLFDGWKFGVVKYFDDQDRAEGVMLDDVAAGMETMAANLATILILGRWF